MTRARLALVLPAVVLAGSLAAASVSWIQGATLRLVDEAGAPASGAYVQFHARGYLINPVHPVSYVASGSVVIRADAHGVARIPGRLHLRSPLPLSTPPKLFIDHVYVPRLHNAFGAIAEGTASRPGVFTIDDRHEHVTVADVSRDPDRWELSLRHLHDCIRETVSREGSRTHADPDDAATLAHGRELIGHLRAEYAAFLERYAQTARARPPAPIGGSERDRQLWEAQTDAQLAREPFWGPYFERTWRFNLAELDALDASLR